MLHRHIIIWHSNILMPNISIRVPENIRKRLDQYVDKNLTKTKVIARALSQYLGINDELAFTERLSEVERGLFEIEK